MLTITIFLDTSYIMGYLALLGAFALVVYSIYEFRMALNQVPLQPTETKTSNETGLTCFNCNSKNIVNQNLPIAFGELIQSFRCKDCDTEVYRKLV